MSSLREDLKALGPRAKADLINKLADAAPSVLPQYGINTALREAHFWAQAAHETGGFKHMFEIWGPTPAQSRYEGRKDLGNTEPGDGFKYRGRGIFQLTGRANYKKYGDILGIDLVGNPDLAADPKVALRIACEYWKSRKLNELADKDDCVAITKKINGGTNGLADRKACLVTAKKMWEDNYDEKIAVEPPKTMATSKQGNAALVTGALGSVAAAKEVMAQVQEATGLIEAAVALLKNPQFLMMAAIVLAGAAIWFWRKKHLEENGV